MQFILTFHPRKLLTLTGTPKVVIYKPSLLESKSLNFLCFSLLPLLYHVYPKNLLKTWKAIYMLLMKI